MLSAEIFHSPDFPLNKLAPPIKGNAKRRRTPLTLNLINYNNSKQTTIPFNTIKQKHPAKILVVFGSPASSIFALNCNFRIGLMPRPPSASKLFIKSRNFISFNLQGEHWKLLKRYSHSFNAMSEERHRGWIKILFMMHAYLVAGISLY